MVGVGVKEIAVARTKNKESDLGIFHHHMKICIKNVVLTLAYI